MKSSFKIFTIILVFTASVLSAQINQSVIIKHENDIFAPVFKQNKIRAYIDKKYEYIDQISADTVVAYELVTVDTSGNILQSALFNKFQQFMGLTKFQYNLNNKIIKTYTFEKNSLLYKSELYYDIYGKLVEEIETDDFGAVHSKLRTYFNSKNQAVKSIIKGISGNIVMEVIYSYNDDNLFTKQEFIKEGKNISSLEFEYNSGQLINSRQFDEKYKIDTKKTYYYSKALPVEFTLTENGTPFIVKRAYFKENQEPQWIETILTLPDFTKYYKEPNYSQHFDYKVPPTFPGGEYALIKYMKENLKYPKKPLKAGIQGLVIVSFAIDESGNIANIRVNKSVEYELDDAAVELVKNMPQWKPALNKTGKPCMSSVELPVDFVIEQ